jgi:AcrR family transcriptional regulator
MRYSEEQQQQTRERILVAVGRGFRSKGFEGIGIDGLAKAAALTSGAFYSTFRSKADAFNAALVEGLEELRQGVLDFQVRDAEKWVEALAEFYFTVRVTCDPTEGCALPSLAADVARGDAKMRSTFEKSYVALVEALAKGLKGAREDAQARAIVMTALFTGGVTLARAVRHTELRDRIAKVLRRAVVAAATD